MTDLIVFRPVADLERTRGFYEGLLGLPLVRDQGDCLIVRAAGAGHLGFCRGGYDGRDAPLPNDPRWITTLVVDDPAAVHERLIAAGAEVEGPPRANPRFGIVQFFLYDPDGYRIEIQSFDEPLPRSNDADGADGADGAMDADGADGATPQATGVVRSRALRAAYLALGWTSVAFGAIGIVVPGWPTTVWLLVAAFAFARSSPRFHRWLVTHRVFGPFIRDVQEGRGMPLRAKVVAVTAIVVFAGSSSVLMGRTVAVWLGATIAVLGAVGVASVVRVPTRKDVDDAARGTSAAGASAATPARVQSSSTSSKSAGPLR